MDLIIAYPTQAQAYQALAVIWAKYGGIGEKPSNELLANAAYVAAGYGLSLGFSGIIPAAAQTANVEARLKELMNPYYGQPVGSNLGQHIGGEHPQQLMANIDWQTWTPLLLQILKLAGTLLLKPAAGQPITLSDPLPVDPAFSAFGDFPPVPMLDEPGNLPGYPPRNIPE